MDFQPIRHVASREQAEEISLLLQSLGMNVQIFQVTQDASAEQAARTRWVVSVELARYAEAQQVLAEEEASRPAVVSAAPAPLPGAQSDYAWVIGLALINIGVWSLMEQHGGTQNRETLLQFGAIKSPLLSGGEWWRLVTAMFIHIGVRHLFGNMAALLVLGGLTLSGLGPGRLIFVYVLSGICGNLAGFIFGSATALKAGASGAIFGLLGALAGMRLRQLHSVPSRFKRWHIIAMVLAVYGFIGGVQYPYTDHIAHFGGIAGGMLAAGVLPALSEEKEHSVQWTLGLLAGGVCVVAWLCVFSF
jgi:rhomboid protease GluP